MAILRQRLRQLCGAVLCAFLGAASAPAADSSPLRVCMAAGNMPLSYRAAGEALGLEVEVARAIAAELGRPLDVVFFDSQYERETSLAQEVNAMLSSGVCELASGYALFAADLGQASRPSARAPDHDGARPRRERPFVPLGRLAAARAYYAMAMGVVTREPGMRVDSLADLQGLRIGAITGTVAGSALLLYRNGVLQKGLVTLSQLDDLLTEMEAGRFDATLTPLNKYDAYRLAHPGTRLTRAGYLHPLRINLGFVGLESEAATLAAASRAIERALAAGDLARWAETAGVTWVPPEAPDVQPPFSIGSLRTE
ncbi:MAG: substrate-binding periplasmic protein [Betaproteobacteria bacterium]